MDQLFPGNLLGKKVEARTSTYTYVGELSFIEVARESIFLRIKNLEGTDYVNLGKIHSIKEKS
jgi:hypothetical protein